MKKVWAKVGIISSVPQSPFAKLDFDSLWFTTKEKKAALMPELQLFLKTIDAEYRRSLRSSGVKFDIIRAMEGMPKHWAYDAYILWWSPAMVGEAREKPRIAEYQEFIHREVSNGTPVLGICFGHQVLVSAFGGSVEDLSDGRTLWSRSVMLNTDWNTDELFAHIDDQFEALWSHKQHVVDPGEGKVLGVSGHDECAIVKLGDDAWWVQFHPEFTSATVSFLSKLMRWQLKNEWIEVEDILSNLKASTNNNWSKIISLFLKKYWNK